ncbi:MAG: hypothetical protein Q8O63_04520, partial [Hoeflea sp.]|nr:hypothetical protein [Hoeflea sp.]
MPLRRAVPHHQFDDAFCELTVLRLKRGNARHQLFNGGFIEAIHQILESKRPRRVNCRIREPSASDLILP